MERIEKTGRSRTKGLPSRWESVLRPLAAWFLFVVILFDIKTHERLMQETRLNFSVSLNGQSVQGNSVAMLDSRRFESGDIIPLGSHIFSVYNEKAEPYSRKLSIWYGPHYLGNIALKRAIAPLTVSAKPPAGLITIQGPEFSLRLTNSDGITTNVPTDRYMVEASYAHWHQREETTVNPLQPGRCAFAPALGVVQLTCNQSEASFQVFNVNNELLDAGDLPASLLDVPEGLYKVIAWHRKNKHKQTLAVKAGITNGAEIEFLYGGALLESDPPGATVVSADGREWGVTPRLFSELPAGEWQFQLRLAGYSPVAAVVVVAADQTNTFRTNLVSINYVPAMNAARQRMATGDYDGAFAAAADALQVKPDDPEAIALQREAAGRGHLRQAESLGKRGDYIGADKELEAALASLPDNEEAKQLLVEWKAREPEQRQQLRQERLLRGKKLFDSVVAGVTDADLFETHELKSGKPVNEVKTAILNALKIRPEFRVTRVKSSVPDAFEIEAVQELTTVLGTSAGRRLCVIVGAQTQDDETDILFKILEYKAEAVNKFSIGAVIGTPVEVKYVPIHPSRIPQITDKMKAQIEEGVKTVTDRIQQAIGGGLERK